MSAPESWKKAYRELIGTIVKMGYPEEYGQANAKYNELLYFGLGQDED